jgi:hypothetical protein
MATVEETKRLILGRLDELRRLREAELNVGKTDLGGLAEPAATAAPVVEPRRQAPARPRRGGLFRSRSQVETGAVEHRITALEDRLAAIERYLVQALRHQPGPAHPPPNPAAHLADAARAGLPSEAQTQAPAAAAPDDLAAALQSGPEQASAQTPTPEAAPDHTPAAAAATGAPGFDYGGEPYRLTGSVDDGLLTDVLQLVASNQKTGRFSLFVDEGASRLDLFFRDGEIVHALAGQDSGEQAFFTVMVLGHQQGYYGFLEGDDHYTGEATISTKTQFLILEALRRIDEEGASGG